MIIKKFNLFESENFSDKFPDLEEIKSYFYDFTDEVDTFIDDYDYGYLYFKDTHRSSATNKLINILGTETSNHRLEYCSDFLSTRPKLIRINLDSESKIKLIESGKESGYEFLFIHFEEYLFKKEKLPILIDCLKTLYSQTEFRPVKSLWTEDWIDEKSDEAVTRCGFEGTFVRVSDDEYRKLCQIFEQGSLTPTLTKLFQ